MDQRRPSGIRRRFDHRHPATTARSSPADAHQHLADLHPPTRTDLCAMSTVDRSSLICHDSSALLTPMEKL
jgi:hypothetical protein